MILQIVYAATQPNFIFAFYCCYTACTVTSIFLWKLLLTSRFYEISGTISCLIFLDLFVCCANLFWSLIFCAWFSNFHFQVFLAYCHFYFTAVLSYSSGAFIVRTTVYRALIGCCTQGVEFYWVEHTHLGANHYAKQASIRFKSWRIRQDVVQIILCFCMAVRFFANRGKEKSHYILNKQMSFFRWRSVRVVIKDPGRSGLTYKICIALYNI